jgi:SAM-dependent methyltransferase
MAASALYDQIGKTYRRTREPDPRVLAAIERALEGCASVLNVGAGTGSYELDERALIAVEPSSTMIVQRPPSSAPVVQARAEALPFKDRSFDAVMAILTVHHWTDRPKGLAECRRVARDRVVLLTIDADVMAQYWLFDYFPRMRRMDRSGFPPLAEFAAAFKSIEVLAVPIPGDCRDGFLGAFWKRPAAFLEPAVRASISSFAKLPPAELEAGLHRLRADLASGAWQRQHEPMAAAEAQDIGYRLIIGR